jgi:uncharacterized protein YndB with AHSA1/START domain
VTARTAFVPNPKTDLVLERVIDVPRELVWTAWTMPEHLLQWYTPRPWQTIECEINLRPGGIFRTMLQSPEGKRFPYVGCYLDVVENERLVWTFALKPGYRPATWTSEVPVYTTVINLTPHGKATKYTAVAMHKDEDGKALHDKMGFHQGWGIVLDQLVEVAKQL